MECYYFRGLRKARHGCAASPVSGGRTATSSAYPWHGSSPRPCTATEHRLATGDLCADLMPTGGSGLESDAHACCLLAGLIGTWRAGTGWSALGARRHPRSQGTSPRFVAFDSVVEQPPNAPSGCVAGNNRERWRRLEWLEGGRSGRDGHQPCRPHSDCFPSTPIYRPGLDHGRPWRI